MEKLRNFIYQQVAGQQLSPKDAKELLKEIQLSVKSKSKDIAITGIGLKLSNADQKNDYWLNLKNGIESIQKFPKNRRKDTDKFYNSINSDPKEVYQKQGYLDAIDGFDASFFKISPAEAQYMSPIHRLFLSTAWEAIEDAGLSKAGIYGQKVGVFVGKSHVLDPLYKEFFDEFDSTVFTGSISGILASRISYYLDLKGPALVIDTTCSSGLVAIHSACESINKGESNMAIAGGICLNLIPSKDRYATDLIESKDYKIKPFDKKSDGTAWGEGVMTVFLKPLEKALKDKDSIYAVIKGSAMNQDGASNGITAPNPESQEALIADLWKRTNINPESISYIETHGTGTSLGDPIEYKALNNAFRRYTNKKQFCGIGTVKPNIGHLAAASGVASLLKVVFALQNKKIPPTINFQEPNPIISFEDSALYFCDQCKDWEKSEYPRRAGVSSFGMSGTNCHIILEEAPENKSGERKQDLPLYPIIITSKDKTLLKENLALYIPYFEKNLDLSLNDIAYTLMNRDQYSCRLVIFARDLNNLMQLIKEILASDLSVSQNEFWFYNELNKKTENLFIQNFNNLLIEDELSIENDFEQKIKDFGRAYVNGEEFIFQKTLSKNSRKLNLPTKSFKKQRFWASNLEKIKNGEDKLDVQITGEAEQDYTNIEQKLAEIWVEILGFKEISVDENFTELGGDSVMAIKILKKIEKIFPDVINVADIFTYGSISKLSDYIYKKIVKPQNEEIEEDSFSELSEDALQSLLSKIKTGETSISEGLNIFEKKSISGENK